MTDTVDLVIVGELFMEGENALELMEHCSWRPTTPTMILLKPSPNAEQALRTKIQQNFPK